jgi:hypothetical protein
MNEFIVEELKKPANFPPLPTNPMIRSISDNTNTATTQANPDTSSIIKRSIADIVKSAAKKPTINKKEAAAIAEESPKKKVEELSSSPPQKKQEEQQEEKEKEDAFPSLCTTSSSDEIKSKSVPFSYADMLKKKETPIAKE